MLKETFQHFFTPAPKYVKDMGYLREVIAIEARYERCAQHWRPHLEKSKEHILKATETLAPGAEIMILGSGGLHDVPMDALAHFKLSCVDIVHLPRVKRKYQGVEFIEKDVTGLAEDIFYMRDFDKSFGWNPSPVPDLIISLNLLSQLAMKPLEYAERYNHDLGVYFSDNILKAHVDWLKMQQTNVLLISDISREYYQGERLVTEIASLPGLELETPTDQWLWDIAPPGEADSEISIRHNVGAWRL